MWGEKCPLSYATPDPVYGREGAGGVEQRQYCTSIPPGRWKEKKKKHNWRKRAKSQTSAAWCYTGWRGSLNLLFITQHTIRWNPTSYTNGKTAQPSPKVTSQVQVTSQVTSQVKSNQAKSSDTSHVNLMQAKIGPRTAIQTSPIL